MATGTEWEVVKRIGFPLAILLLTAANPAAASPPARDEGLTGCVRGDHLEVEPEPGGRFRNLRLRIKPCTNTPFDLEGLEGKRIRAMGGVDLRNDFFTCPREVSVLGGCKESPDAEMTASCQKPDPAAAAPGDFRLTYVSGPAHAEWGGKVVISIDSAGTVTREEEGRGPDLRGVPGDLKVSTWQVPPVGSTMPRASACAASP